MPEKYLPPIKSIYRLEQLESQVTQVNVKTLNYHARRYILSGLSA